MHKLTFYLRGMMAIPSLIILTLSFGLAYAFISVNPAWANIHFTTTTALFMQAAAIIWAAMVAVTLMSVANSRPAPFQRSMLQALAICAGVVVAFAVAPLLVFLAGQKGSLVPEQVHHVVLNTIIILFQLIAFSQVPWLHRLWQSRRQPAT